jgi:uncharacterized membrane protein
MDFVFFGIFAILVIAAVIYLIYQRMKESEKEDFDKRDN